MLLSTKCRLVDLANKTVYQAREIPIRQPILIAWARQHCRAARDTEMVRAARRACAARLRVQASEMAQPVPHRAAENAERCKAAGSLTPPWRTTHQRRRRVRVIRRRQWLTFWTNLTRNTPRKGVVLDSRATWFSIWCSKRTARFK